MTKTCTSSARVQKDARRTKMLRLLGRSRSIAGRARYYSGLLPRQLRSIDGAHKKAWHYINFHRKYDLYTPTVYTHIPNSEITPLHPLCTTSTLTFNKLFASTKGYIY